MFHLTGRNASIGQIILSPDGVESLDPFRPQAVYLHTVATLNKPKGPFIYEVITSTEKIDIQEHFIFCSKLDKNRVSRSEYSSLFGSNEERMAVVIPKLEMCY